MAEPKLGRQISDLYVQFTAGSISRRELAKRVGTTASVICRLEDADYDGHSMSMLNRIAEALGYRVELRFVRRTKQAA